MVEVTVAPAVTPLSPYWFGGFEKSFLLDLEEDFGSGTGQGAHLPSTSSGDGWLRPGTSEEVGFELDSQLDHPQVILHRVVGKARHIMASDVPYKAICAWNGISESEESVSGSGRLRTDTLGVDVGRLTASPEGARSLAEAEVGHRRVASLEASLLTATIPAMAWTWLINSVEREARGRLEGVAWLRTSWRPGAFSLVLWLDSCKERPPSGGGASQRGPSTVELAPRVSVFLTPFSSIRVFGSRRSSARMFNAAGVRWRLSIPWRSMLSVVLVLLSYDPFWSLRFDGDWAVPDGAVHRASPSVTTRHLQMSGVSSHIESVVPAPCVNYMVSRYR
ncbi:hypothetical protein GW17_00017658 [Ensete ventricosum]|nr:hypothetical protein GW17_00017658 [Ensete ventricosum]